jgi:hypothetical protein
MRWKWKGVGVGGKSEDGVTLGKWGRWYQRKRGEGREGSNTSGRCYEILEGLGTRLK